MPLSGDRGEAPLTIWRIHYRNGKTKLVDDAELERLRGLQRRTYIGVEKAKMHICMACGREGAWDDDWGWYGSIEQIDNWQGEKPQIPKWCSTNCMEALKVAGKIPKRAPWLDEEKPAVREGFKGTSPFGSPRRL